MNIVVVTGNLGKDAEPKDANGKPFCSFSIAVKTGKDKTAWLGCSYFADWAHETAARMTKGSRVTVSGRLSSFTNKEGKEVLTITADSVEIAGKRNADDATPAVARSAKSYTPDSFDEIPF